MDVYIGLADTSPFAFVTSKPSGTFVAYVVEDSAVGELLSAAHRLNAPPP